MRDIRVSKKSHTSSLPLDGPSHSRSIYTNEIAYLFWNGSCFFLHQNTGCLVQGDPFYQMISSSSQRGVVFRVTLNGWGVPSPPSSDPQGSKLRVTIWPFFAKEDVTEVPIALLAQNLRAHHAVRLVYLEINVAAYVGVVALVVGWPAAPRVELGREGVQREPAALAGVVTYRCNDFD